MLDRFATRARFARVFVATLGAVLLLLGLAWPALAQRQPTPEPTTPCVDCVLYAYTDLNLRKAPSLEAVVLSRVPKGAAVRRTTGAVQNGYAPVVYAGIPGWVVALGLVVSPTEVEPDATAVPPAAAGPTRVPAPAPVPATTVASERVALSTINLRSGPSADAAVIATIPTGGLMTLTGEGAEGGYVTVVYNGTPGWVYADLIGVP